MRKMDEEEKRKMEERDMEKGIYQPRAPTQEYKK